jgi:hypothetical protein
VITAATADVPVALWSGSRNPPGEIRGGLFYHPPDESVERSLLHKEGWQ